MHACKMSVTHPFSPTPQVVPSSLAGSLDAAVAEGDRSMALQLVESAVQLLKETRGRPDPVLNTALATCFGKHASFFATPSVIEVGRIPPTLQPSLVNSHWL